MKLTLRADDRVLFLGMPSHKVLVETARLLMQGVVVALGTPEDVAAARRALAAFDNVMLVESEPTAIPWRDSYFTRIIVPPEFAPLQPAAGAEWARILAPQGELVLDVEEV